MERKSESQKVDPLFLERWSPRAFESTPIPSEDRNCLFEAARWAPSCYNEQPWHFVYAKNAVGKEKILHTLVDANRVWAARAPLLIIVFCRKNFVKTQKPNDWAAFDAGSAWMSFALQALKLGYHTHAMAGFSKEKAYHATGLSKEKYYPMAVIAVGKKGKKSLLPDPLQKAEYPNQRKKAEEFTQAL